LVHRRARGTGSSRPQRATAARSSLQDRKDRGPIPARTAGGSLMCSERVGGTKCFAWALCIWDGTVYAARQKGKAKETTYADFRDVVSTYMIGAVAGRRVPCSLIALSPTAMVRRAALLFMGPSRVAMRRTILDLVPPPCAHGPLMPNGCDPIQCGVSSTRPA
jgi:hypothetical protein